MAGFALITQGPYVTAVFSISRITFKTGLKDHTIFSAKLHNQARVGYATLLYATHRAGPVMTNRIGFKRVPGFSKRQDAPLCLHTGIKSSG